MPTVMSWSWEEGWVSGEREGERDFCTACPCYSCVSRSMHVHLSVLASRLNASPTLISGIWVSSGDSFSAVPRERRYARILLKITWQKVFAKPEIWMWSLPWLDFLSTLCDRVRRVTLVLWRAKSHLATGTQTAMESWLSYLLILWHWQHDL